MADSTPSHVKDALDSLNRVVRQTREDFIPDEEEVTRPVINFDDNRAYNFWADQSAKHTRRI